MSEVVVQMLPMLLLGGLIMGWTAEAVSSAGGYGLLPDMTLGLVGGTLAGAGLWAVVAGGVGMVAMLLAGGVGAALTIAAQRALWRSARPAA